MNSEKRASAPVADSVSLKLQVDAAIASARLPVDAEWRASIDAHFEAIAKAAALVMEFPLEDELDAAPVFSA
ncbi:MAG: 1-carboxybiuret hydrolase subunit AtzG-like [Methylobacteriaceae bacterium]|jgi:hypothetical protein|nr:1-carboxybiuret hydrolase subunit AtzG-like [Methylobacteriaceae bacterium]